MADISVQKKNGADLTWVWAVAAVIAIVGLMAWLMITRESATTTAVTLTPADTVTEATTPAAGEAVELTAVGAAPDQFLGRTLQIESAPVSVVLGNRGYWADIPGANPLLVIVGPSVTDASWVDIGAAPSVVATVEPVTEAELDSWVQANYIQADARAQAAFVSHYLLVTEATP